MSEMKINGKKSIEAVIEGAGEELISLSHSIHDNPELGFQEYKAV